MVTAQNLHHFEKILIELPKLYPNIAKDIFDRFVDDHPIVGDERTIYQAEILFQEHKQIFAALYKNVTEHPVEIEITDFSNIPLPKRPPEGTDYAYNNFFNTRD